MSQELILTSRLNRMIEQQYLKQMVSIFKYTYNYTHACIHSLYPSLHPFSPPCHTHTHTHTHTHAGRHKNINTHFLCCKRQLQSTHTHTLSLPSKPHPRLPTHQPNHPTQTHLRLHSRAAGGCKTCHTGLWQESQEVGVRKVSGRKSCPL